VGVRWALGDTILANVNSGATAASTVAIVGVSSRQALHRATAGGIGKDGA